MSVFYQLEITDAHVTLRKTEDRYVTACLAWEYARNLQAVRKAVLELRQGKPWKEVLGAGKSYLASGVRWYVEFEDWPEKPFSALSKGVKDEFAFGFVDSVPAITPAEISFAESGALVSDLNGPNGGTLHAFFIDWSKPDRVLRDHFERLLVELRPEGTGREKVGRGSDASKERRQLKLLDAWRLAPNGHFKKAMEYDGAPFGKNEQTWRNALKEAGRYLRDFEAIVLP